MRYFVYHTILQRPQRRILWSRFAACHRLRVFSQSKTTFGYKSDFPWCRWLAAQRARQIPCFQRNVRTHGIMAPSRAHLLTLLCSSVSTLRAALELKNVFEQIQAAELAGNLSPEEKRRLEEQAAEKGLQALFKVCAGLAYMSCIRR